MLLHSARAGVDSILTDEERNEETSKNTSKIVKSPLASDKVYSSIIRRLNTRVVN